jgi:nitroreductase
MKKLSLAILGTILSLSATAQSAPCAANNPDSNQKTTIDMNSTINDIVTRRSIRKYLDKEVDQQLIEQIVMAGTYAPTGMNRQSPIILAVTNREMRDKLSKINASIMGRDGDPFYGAPVVLVVLARKDAPTYIYDGSLVMGNLMNAAHSLGLGSCWIHRAKETFESEEGKAILKQLGIEGEYEGIGNCIIGYADPEGLKPATPRKADYVYWIK